MNIIQFLLNINFLNLTKKNIKIYKKTELKISKKRYIKTLNKRYRKINNYTDILTFKEKNKFLIIICIDLIKENEINKILIHGLLHLIGYDHEKEKDNKIMNNISFKIGMSGIEPPTFTTSK